MLKAVPLPNPCPTSTPAPKTIAPYDTYQCTVGEDFLRIAREQLREDDNIRSQALAQFREWIAKHPYIKKCRTDAVFLLRFLRTKKFSVPAACEMLEKYLTIRQLYPAWFRKLDIEDPAINEIVSAGYLVPLLQRDALGRQVIMSCAGKFDPHRYTSAQMARVHSLVCEALMDDEESQITGYNHINDESGLAMAHVSLWSLTDIRNMMRCIQNSTPMRHKETHFINLPHYGSKLIEFMMTILNEKLKKRIVLHSSLDDLKRHVDPSILPKEYGGVVPLSEMIDKLKIRLKQKRQEILALDDFYIEISKTAANFAGSEDADMDAGVVGSFRKLEVD
ncbi:clavesin-1 [Phlebotomus argentipes]|uniref:clavesin-1 n=1 Tax=Phlebotomus argentipes TaxID=94469 RepID=UPI0028936D3B|nr:clavesin-1 [Phlebotomus argentipes]